MEGKTSIEDYKNKLVAIIEEMQKEHGCVVSSVEIKRREFSAACFPDLNIEEFHVEINL